MLLAAIIIGNLFSTFRAESCNTLWTIMNEGQEMTIMMCLSNIEQPAIVGELFNSTLSNNTNISSIKDIYNINASLYNASLYNTSLYNTSLYNVSTETNSTFNLTETNSTIDIVDTNINSTNHNLSQPTSPSTSDLTPSPEKTEPTGDDTSGDLEIISTIRTKGDNVLNNLTNTTDSKNLKTEEEENYAIIISSIGATVVVLIIFTLVIIEKRKSKGVKPLCSGKHRLKNGKRRNPFDRPKDYIIEHMVHSPLTKNSGVKVGSELV